MKFQKTVMLALGFVGGIMVSRIFFTGATSVDNAGLVEDSDAVELANGIPDELADGIAEREEQTEWKRIPRELQQIRDDMNRSKELKKSAKTGEGNASPGLNNGLKATWNRSVVTNRLKRPVRRVVNQKSSTHTTTHTTTYGLTGFESPTEVVFCDPLNPKPGMVFSAYNYTNWMEQAQRENSNSILQKMAALKSGVDNSQSFSIKCSTGVNATAIRWEGFLKCKMKRTFTFLIRRPGDWNDGYSVKINGKTVVTGCGENSFDVDLRVGWNKVEIVCQFGDKEPALELSAKIKGGLSEPTKLTPAKFFYDDRPELTSPSPFR